MLVPPAQGQNGVGAWRLLQCAGASLDGQSKESSAYTVGHVEEEGQMAAVWTAVNVLSR